MNDTHTPWELMLEQTRNVCDLAQFTFATTDTLPEPHDMPGQRRAQEAIAFALERCGTRGIIDEGYHLYISARLFSERMRGFPTGPVMANYG